MELSKRLYAVAGLVTEGASVADIGTDHGYVPIYLEESGIASKVIALDVNQGPLNRARMHIVGHGLGDRIETRLSDGLAMIRPGEVDTVIASGMAPTPNWIVAPSGISSATRFPIVSLTGSHLTGGRAGSVESDSHTAVTWEMCI